MSDKIAVIGLGYVGLPLAIEFGKQFPVVGFDISQERISQLKNFLDITKEIESQVLKDTIVNDFNSLEIKTGFLPTQEIKDIKDCNIFIITVPTPIDDSKKPDLNPLESSSKMIASVLKKGDIVIYESTTYPGCTEEFCVPILEKNSGLIYNQDFFVGYSPERINPGDKVNTLTKIKKVTSGSNEQTATKVDELYKSIIVAGTYKAKSIKVAEASKAIENAQRDVNISFVNELAIIFEKLNIDTTDVLEAASTKWNFLPYKPGLVGGHCIGVDPYYLAYRSELAGYQPNVILSGRRVNDQMGTFIANKVLKIMIAKEILIKNSEILILGITFKENCPDIRNTKVVDVYKELKDFGCNVTILDPYANKHEVEKEYGLKIYNNIDEISIEKFDSIILAVAHQEFSELQIKNLCKENFVIYDCKSVIDRDLVSARL